MKKIDFFGISRAKCLYLLQILINGHNISYNAQGHAEGQGQGQTCDTKLSIVAYRLVYLFVLSVLSALISVSSQPILTKFGQ